MLGYEVDAINSVQFTNHTQYEHVKGQILKSEELSDLVDGLEKNDLLSLYSHLLTGKYALFFTIFGILFNRHCNNIDIHCYKGILVIPHSSDGQLNL